MNTEKIKEIFSDKAFVKSLTEMETAAQVQAAMQVKDVELTEEESSAILELVCKIKCGEITKEQLEIWKKQYEDGELSEDALTQVSGGILGITMGILFGGMALVGAGCAVIAYFETRDK